MDYITAKVKEKARRVILKDGTAMTLRMDEEVPEGARSIVVNHDVVYAMRREDFLKVAIRMV